MALRLAYNTNGCSNHRFEDALELIADAGYQGVALTVDHHHFDPLAPRLESRAYELSRRLKDLDLGLVVETGARFLLDPRHKHEPTLVSPEPQGRARRLEFLTRCLELCACAEGETVSFWAGKPRAGIEPERAREWLLEGLRAVQRAAEDRGVVASLEPEPGMLLATVDDYRAVQAEVPGLRLALDTGHCIVTGERDPAEAVREFAADLGTVALEDMKRGEHLHLPFGQGDMDVAGVLRALKEIQYDRLVCVELSRESPRAHEAIPEAIRFLRRTEMALAAQVPAVS